MSSKLHERAQRKQNEAEVAAATTIEAATRGHKERVEARKHKDAVKVIQMQQRNHVATLQHQKETSAATTIGKYTRGRQQRVKVTRLFRLR